MRVLLSLAVLAVGLTPAAAAAPAKGPKHLTLTPVAASVPVLKHRLLPDLFEQHPGNAVEHYRCAASMVRGAINADAYQQIESWMELPSASLPREDIRAFLVPFAKAMAEAEAGARSEFCDWGLAERLRKDGIAALLPDIQEMRSLATLFIVRLRLELAEGQPDKAVLTARTCLAMARHVADAPTLINALVGAAITARTIEALERLVQQPNAPSLYWPLTDLPRPFIDLRKPLQGERLMAYGTFPGLLEVARDPGAILSPEQVAKISGFLLKTGNELGMPLPNRAVLAFLLLQKHEMSKQALVERGWPRDRVEAMPHLQVALLHSLSDYDAVLDEAVKWQSQPYWEAAPALRELDRQRQRRVAGVPLPGVSASEPALPLARLLSPAVHKVIQARTRVERRLAALRVVEALRLHAVTTGRLPASLSEVRELPLPPDPFSGRPFEYRLEGDRALLSSAPVEGVPDIPGYKVSYEIRLRR
jgi:hypothetical protein